ncbi:MAG: hypothetical protein IJF29_04930 [Firmicutes bacterium]|nr:hypothetical protein [Bacillota bacterium]
MVKKRRSYKKKNKKGRISFKAVLSLMLVVLALGVANLSFLSFARDSMYLAVSENMKFEDIKDVFSLSITAIKDIMNDNKEKENDEIINNFPPEVILPDTE